MSLHRVFSAITRPRTLLFGMILGLSLLTSFGPPAPSNEDQIRQVRQFSNESIARQDTAALASTWATDIRVLSSRSAEVSGIRANQQALSREFQAGKIFIRTPREISVYEPWKMAAEQGSWIGRWKDPSGPVEISGVYFAKWHFIGGKWKIRSETYVPTQCMGTRYCSESPL